MSTLPLCGDPHAHAMLEKGLLFPYPLGTFAADYEAARARVPPGATSGEAAAWIETILCARYGRPWGLLRAVRMQAVVVALATRWGELRAKKLVRTDEKDASETKRPRVLPIRCVDPALLSGFLKARVQAPDAPMTGLRLDHREVDQAIAQAARRRESM